MPPPHCFAIAVDRPSADPVLIVGRIVPDHQGHSSPDNPLYGIIHYWGANSCLRLQVRYCPCQVVENVVGMFQPDVDAEEPTRPVLLIRFALLPAK